MNILPRTTLVSSLFAVLGLVLGLKKSRIWFLLSALAGFFLLFHTQHGRCALPVTRRFGDRKTEEIEAAAAELSQLRDKFADNRRLRPSPSKEDPGI